MKPAPSLPALFRARGKRRGFSPAAAARHRSRTRGPQILTFLGVYFWFLCFSPCFFHFFLRSDFIHCPISDRGKLARKTSIFGIATIWRRIKPCPISKKIRKKEENRISDPKKNQGCPISHQLARSTWRHYIRVPDPAETRKTLSDLKKSTKKGHFLLFFPLF